MTARDYVTYGLVLTVLVVGLVFANTYYIQPSLTPQLPKPEPLPPQATFTTPVDSNIVATTLEKIKTMFPQKEFQKEFEPRRVQRNPFFWPEEMTGEGYPKAPVSAEAKEDEEKKGLLQLSMILIGENRKLALINENLVFEGTRINGDLVYKIEETEVILKGDTGETRLALSEYIASPPVKEERLTPPEPLPKTTPAQEETIESLFEKLKPLLQPSK